MVLHLTPAAAMSSIPTVEHLVLFRANDGVEPAASDAWLSGLRSLASLDVVAHLTAVPVLRCRSSSADFLPFTHVLHCRFRTEADLAVYAVHPAHLSVLRELGAPVCNDILAVDWVAGINPEAVAVKGGFAARVMLARLRQGVGNEENAEVLNAFGRIGRSCPEVEQASYGQNVSPERAKGFAAGSIWVVRGLEELDMLDVAEREVMGAEGEKVNPLMESIIVVDFVVSAIPEVSSSSIAQSIFP